MLSSFSLRISVTVTRANVNSISREMVTPTQQFDRALKLHAAEFAVELSPDAVQKLNDYYELLLKWNGRLHLVAPCSAEEFAVRHVLESLLLLKHLPRNAMVVDVGSGGGLPIIPCLAMRDDLRANLIESSQKKAVFLNEALRQIRAADRAKVIAVRFEDVTAPRADFLTSRALDRFGKVLPKLVAWARPATTFLLFGGPSLRTQIEGLLPSVMAQQIPHSTRRFLIIASRSN
jgi:16S rRNA (guanine(527)-N(7))-methyltransferase RsmG